LFLITALPSGKVSLDRIGQFLQDTELLDSFAEELENKATINHYPDQDDVIGFNNAVFAWSRDIEDGTQTPSSRSFRLRIEGRVTFKKNSINLIVGPT
jgi:hypothetical protein